MAFGCHNMKMTACTQLGSKMKGENPRLNNASWCRHFSQTRATISSSLVRPSFLPYRIQVGVPDVHEVGVADVVEALLDEVLHDDDTTAAVTDAVAAGRDAVAAAAVLGSCHRLLGTDCALTADRSRVQSVGRSVHVSSLDGREMQRDGRRGRIRPIQLSRRRRRMATARLQKPRGHSAERRSR